MTRNINDRLLLLTAAMALTATPAMGQQAEQADPPELTIKVYRVDDLVVPSPNYPFRGTALPDLSQRGRRTGNFGLQGMGGVSMGMMGEAAGGDVNQDGSGSRMGMGGGPMGLGGGMGMGGGRGPMGGGLAGAMGGGAGGSSGQPSGFSMTVPGLMEAIKTFVEPASWVDVNQSYDSGDIRSLGGSLVVRQKLAAHEKIEAFLQELRQELGAMRTLTVQAHWLSLDSKQLAKLLGDDGRQSTDNVIDRDAWREIASADHTIQPYRGQVTCFNGQTVHVVSGRLHSVLQGGVPITSGSAVGYQPLTLTPHIGAMLQITPSLLPGRRSALLDLQSTVTRWDGDPKTSQATAEAAGIEAHQSKLAAPADEPAHDEDGGSTERRPGARGGRTAPARGAMSGSAGMMSQMGGTGMAMMGRTGASGMAADETSSERPAGLSVDRVNIVAQQLATSLRVPLGEPVLVGGMTFPGSEEGEPAGDQLYLVIEVTVQEEPDPGDSTEIRSPRRRSR